MLAKQAKDEDSRTKQRRIEAFRKGLHPALDIEWLK